MSVEPNGARGRVTVPRVIAIFSSVQDFRLKRRGSIQAIAEELARSGHEVTFVSLRFSPLSGRRKDPRMALRRQANRVERFEGVKCFLWWTMFHPFNTRFPILNALLTPLFHIYARYPNRALDDIIRSATTIIIESGLAIALLPRIRRINPSARLLYRGSDRLSVIAQHGMLAKLLRKHQAAFDAFCLLGPGMAADFDWAFPKAYVVPPAFDRSVVERVHSNPFDKPLNAVSLGAMLFDASFFEIASEQFPEVTFHIFGVSTKARARPNVRYHPEISYAETWRYIRHASIGIAAYRDEPNAGYLADTSSKLLQYGAVGLPSVCPRFAVGGYDNRFGYDPGNPASMASAIRHALSMPRSEARPFHDWFEIVPRLLSPERFPDTKLGSFPSHSLDAPILSLVVATKGRTAPLVRLLSSLQAQPRSAFEVIVVDQNAPGVLDDLLERFAVSLDLHHLRTKPGLSHARNVGLDACRGALVGFPDDDCWYPADRVAEILHFFDVYTSVGVLLGQTVDATGLPSVNATRPLAETLSAKTVWFSGNSNTLFMRKPLAAALRFDEGLGVGAATPFQSGEETDLVLRALQRGVRGVYCPNLTIHHDQVDSTIGWAQLRRAWRYSTGFGQVLRRHYPLRYTAYRIVRSAVSGFAALTRADLRKAAYRSTWSLGTMRGWLYRPARERSQQSSSLR